MNFKDIPKFTRQAAYRVDTPWDHLERCLDRYKEDYNLELDPDFQRAHVWNIEKQIKFVEFKLRGGQSANELYFNCPGFRKGELGQMVLVDGKQRLEAVRKFMRNELPVFGGHYLLDFEGIFPIFDFWFRFYVNDLQTRKEVLQWYLDINEGGVVHTESELSKVKELLKKEH